jgi:two-component system chemotaxis response regulator CheB
MIKVLIVDDSQTTLEYLKYLLSLDKEIVITGIADNGREAVELSQRKPPDVILMDIHMPQMDGFEATRIIMERNPAPIVIMSASHNVKDTDVIFRAMEAGAVALANKPRGLDHPDYESSVKELIQTVKLMAEIKVIRRRPIVKRKPEEREPRPESLFVKPTVSPAAIRVIAMGASAGGPPVLQAILSRIAKKFPASLLIVQHIACGFVEGLIEWLSQTTDCPIHLATHEETLLPGHIYFAPDNYHMGVGNSGRIVLSKGGSENGSRPSISYLFRSVAEVYGANAVGVLLTGMGRDGADGLKLMRDQGAITIVQDQASSLVHGMAGEAIKLNGAMYELHYDNIAPTLLSLVN